MKRIVLIVVTFLAAGGWTQAIAQDNKPDTKVVYVDHNRLAEAGALANGPGYAVSISRRTGMGMVEVHEKITDTFYILSGAATFVTGGEAVDLKPTAPNELRGTVMNGGDVHHLSKGDVIVIPAGVPHWFKDIPESPCVYYMVKVSKP